MFRIKDKKVKYEDLEVVKNVSEKRESLRVFEGIQFLIDGTPPFNEGTNFAFKDGQIFTRDSKITPSAENQNDWKEVKGCLDHDVACINALRWPRPLKGPEIFEGLTLYDSFLGIHRNPIQVVRDNLSKSIKLIRIQIDPGCCAYVNKEGRFIVVYSDIREFSLVDPPQIKGQEWLISDAKNGKTEEFMGTYEGNYPMTRFSVTDGDMIRHFSDSEDFAQLLVAFLDAPR